MRIQETKLYKFEELPEDTQKKVIEKYREKNDEIFFQTEILDSLMSVFKTANIRVKDYELGMNCYSYLKLDLDDSISNLTGARALAWLENNLFSKLRMTRHEYMKNRKDNFRYGYRIGAIKDCPLTGYCADHDFLDALKQNVIDKDSLSDAFKNLANTYQKLLEQEWKAQNSEEYIIDHITANDYEFTESGNMY